MPNPIIGGKFIPVRLAAQFDKTTTTLATITGFEFDGLAGRSYRIRVKFSYTANASGGIKVALSGTATFTDVRIAYENFDSNALSIAQIDQLVAKDGAKGLTGPTAGTVQLDGTVVVNAAGTVNIQAACQAAVGTTSILAGAVFEYQLCQ